MYRTLIKRIIEIKVEGETPEEILKLAREKKFEEKIISDTFMVKDKEDIVIAKHKVIYVGDGEVLRYDKLLERGNISYGSGL